MTTNDLENAHNLLYTLEPTNIKLYEILIKSQLETRTELKQKIYNYIIGQIAFNVGAPRYYKCDINAKILNELTDTELNVIQQHKLNKIFNSYAEVFTKHIGCSIFNQTVYYISGFSTEYRTISWQGKEYPIKYKDEIDYFIKSIINSLT